MSRAEESVPPVLELIGISKRFPGVTALEDVSFSLEAGRVHALIGQNGAGKSTLINILSGMIRPDEGQVRIDGRDVRIADPREAHRLGIATVYQELSLLPNLTIAENLALGREPRRGPMLDRAAMRANAVRTLAILDLHIDPDVRVSSLPLAEKQLIEIAKALSTEPRILVLDEPTAPLGPRECRLLFDAIRRLEARGVAILYVSHRFSEVLVVCGIATVLRNGRHVLTTALDGWSEGRLTEAMIGARSDAFTREEHDAGPAAIEVRGIRLGDKVRGVDLDVRRGEILGITGLLGAGQNELARLIGGEFSPDGGTIRVDGRERRFRSPADAIARGICLMTEERKQEGILPNRPVRENIGIGSLPARSGPLGIVRAGEEARATGQAAETFGVVARTLDAPMRSLSGGNQQKALVARWHLAEMDVFVLIEPTRGVDVGSRADIYRRLDELARAGKAVVVVSSDIAEVLAVADRILVLHEGVVGSEVSAGDVDEEGLNLLVQGALAS